MHQVAFRKKGEGLCVSLAAIYLMCVKAHAYRASQQGLPDAAGVCFES